RFGDFEMDLIVDPAQRAILTLVEKSTNMLLMQKLPFGKQSKPLAKAVSRLLLPYKDRLKTITTDNGLKVQKAKSGKCWASRKSKKSGRAYSRKRKPSRSRLTNGLKMELQPSGVMQMARTTISSQSRVTLLRGASLLKHSSMVLTQLTKSNVGWLLPIC
ncbi:MAG: hypothetical protein SOZ80_02240, partial [Prevotella sp.]|nr:hypothetical protein [Prevotellaceae bacterium]MDY4019587.1 hypothetical protein [Prevotella sp.]